MQIEEIQNRLRDIENSLTEKGYCSEASLNVRRDGFSVHASTGIAGPYGGPSVCASGETLAEAFDVAHARIAHIPAPQREEAA